MGRKTSDFRGDAEVSAQQDSGETDLAHAEFGIGKWGFGRFYREMGSSVVGIDIVDYSARHPGVEFVLSDGDTINLPDASVDMTVSHSVLEHVSDLERSLAEINRITRPGGQFFLTVSPLYYSAYGAHMRVDGKRLENWEHLDAGAPSYLSENPMPGANSAGHSLNKLTSSKFLASVGRQPWSILAYDITFEGKAPPASVDRTQCSEMELLVRGFRFVGRRER